MIAMYSIDCQCNISIYLLTFFKARNILLSTLKESQVVYVAL